MQGHPESPRLWEKHADSILQDIGTMFILRYYLRPTLLKQQVDDFAIAAPDERTATILLDLIDDELSIRMKHQGYLDMYNGIDVLQTRNYIKISTTTFIDKICDKYLLSWMHNFTTTTED
jgi:hypothetical protein